MGNLSLRSSSPTWTLAIGLIALCVALDGLADAPQVIIKEDFESYNSTEGMRLFWVGGTAELCFPSPGGGKAASHDGDAMNRHGGFSVGPDAEHNIVLSADFYDFGTNSGKRVTVSLRRTNGESLDMGLLSTATYAARVMGFSSRTNWIPFAKAQLPVRGWHRFQAVLSLTNAVVTLDLDTDGKIDFTLRIPFTSAPGQFTQLRFGGLTDRPSAGGPVLVDNLKLERLALNDSGTVPVTATPSGAAAARNRPNLPTPTTANYPAAVWWIFVALAVIIALLAGMLMLIKRSWPAKSQALVPFGAGDTNPEYSSGESTAEARGWRQRAVAAEALAARQAQILGEKVGPDLAEFAKQALVQGLHSQRNALIETQEKAREALAELEQRLAELQLPISDRLRAYETRIAELEKELETRGQEMRELTQATLLLVREKLQQEREARGPDFN